MLPLPEVPIVLKKRRQWYINTHENMSKMHVLIRRGGGGRTRKDRVYVCVNIYMHVHVQFKVRINWKHTCMYVYTNLGDS